MPRHVPDDFSFLPTVDSTDEEIMEKRELHRTGSPPAPAEPEVEDVFEHAPAHSDPHTENEHGHHSEQSWHSPEQEDTAPLEDSHHDAPTTILPLGAVDDPPVQDLAPEEQDGHALWQEFMRQDQPAAHEDLTPAPEQPAAQAPSQTPPEPKAVSKAPAAVPSEASAKAQKPASKVQEKEAEKSLPIPRAPEVLSLRVERGERTPAATPPVSFGAAPKAAKAKDSGRQRSTSDDLETSSSDDSAESGPDPKPFTAPKPPPEEPLHPDQERKVRWRKLVEKAGFRSLGWSVVAHLVILILAALIGFNQVVDKQVDFMPGGGSAQSQSAAAELTNKMQQKKNPWLKTKPRMQKVTVQTLTADIVLPEMPMDVLDMSAITNRMDIKAAGLGGGPMGMGSAGAGGGFGSGIGRGGKFSFVGQTALGKRVVFVVDVSGSMSAIGTGETISRFDLLKKELVKSINQMPMNTQYQILFFSDFAWPHDQVDSRDVNALTKYRWEIEPKNYKNVKLPTFRFIQATPFSLRETADIIQRSDNPGGTNWGSGLLMALNASPKPDVIFFMTDGLRSDEQGWVDIVTAENKRRLPMTAIYTSAMQQPDAAKELDDLARRNNGRFTVVLGDGKIVKGEDFFKMKR